MTKKPFRIKMTAKNGDSRYFMAQGPSRPIHARFATRAEAEARIATMPKLYELSVVGPVERFFIRSTDKKTLVSKILPTGFATRAEAKAAAVADSGTMLSIIAAPKGMRGCWWCFCDGKVWFGFTDDTLWNGFLNVWILPETRTEVAAEARKGGEDDEEYANMLFHEQPDKNGLISLAYGSATSEVVS